MTRDELRALLAGLPTEVTQLTLPVVTLRALAGPEELPPAPEELLTAPEAAERLGVSVDWLYRRTAQLPFARKLSRKVTRYSAAGLRAYLAGRDGAA